MLLFTRIWFFRQAIGLSSCILHRYHRSEAKIETIIDTYYCDEIFMRSICKYCSPFWYTTYRQIDDSQNRLSYATSQSFKSRCKAKDTTLCNWTMKTYYTVNRTQYSFRQIICSIWTWFWQIQRLLLVQQRT